MKSIKSEILKGKIKRNYFLKGKRRDDILNFLGFSFLSIFLREAMDMVRIGRMKERKTA